jgi:hypothetical protein
VVTAFTRAIVDELPAHLGALRVPVNIAAALPLLLILLGPFVVRWNRRALRRGVVTPHPGGRATLREPRRQRPRRLPLRRPTRATPSSLDAARLFECRLLSQGNSFLVRATAGEAL